MIPEFLQNTVEFQPLPSYTYSLNGGMIDGLEAVKQAVCKILQTERFEYPIYSWDYGIETYDLFGVDSDLVKVEIQRRITEALMEDDRILSVQDFEINNSKGKINVAFTVRCGWGEVNANYDI